MCGYAGFIDNTNFVNDWDNLLINMGKKLLHRGPDSSGIWHDRSAGVGLVHRRLAINDLSSAGSQPMISHGNRYVIVFNGEIYNHLELRKELPRQHSKWEGHSDTETLINYFEEYGIDRTLRKCNGMFSIAIWDRRLKQLFLARDRFGEKPLYYGYVNGIFLFGSQLKALKSHYIFDSSINREALNFQLSHEYIPAPFTIYNDIKKLPAGTYIKYLGKGEVSNPIEYWSSSKQYEIAQQNIFKGSFDEANIELEKLLENAIKSQMLSDVPVGAFLSGGIDSSSIVSLMQKNSSVPINTFTIGFDDKKYDESTHAKCVADHLKTNHRQLILNSKDVIDVIPEMPLIYDEPFSDKSQIPTYILSKLTRKYVTVALSGDGGDELFFGYRRYSFLSKLWQFSNLTRPLSQIGINLNIDSIILDNSYKLNKLINTFDLQEKISTDKIYKLNRLFFSTSKNQMYSKFMSNFSEDSGVLMDRKEKTSIFDYHSISSKYQFEEEMMLNDLINYLPENILVKVDRASMANGLECRAPFLDRKLVEFIFSLPIGFKKNIFNKKKILKNLAYKYIPYNILNRPKQGFNVPIGDWLKGPLKEWVEDTINSTDLKQDGYLNSCVVRDRWNEFLHGKRNWERYIWNVLMFQTWKNTNF
tara:strand:- start:15500 stop:17431 length:1932 start_codon:yes stop_codon:yes gene_type:complete